MPTQVDYPNGIGTLDEWTLGAGADKVVAVGSADATDATYISVVASAANKRERYTFPALPAAVNPVTSCVWSCVVRTNPGNPTGGTFDIFDGNAEGAGQALSSTYATKTQNHFSSDPGVISSSQGGVKSDLVDQEVRVTQLFRTTVYTPAGGGFAFFFHWLLPLVGAGLTFGQFRRAVALIPDVRFRDDELLTFWREWVAWKHPVMA